MSDSDQLNSTEILNQAIRECEIHRKRHVRMSQTILLGGIVLLTVIAFFTISYARLEAPLRDRRYLDSRWKVSQWEDYIEEKVSELERFEEELTDAKVELSEFEEKAKLLPPPPKETNSKKEAGQHQQKRPKSDDPSEKFSISSWRYSSMSSQDEYAQERVSLASDIGRAKSQVESISKKITDLQKTIDNARPKLVELREKADNRVTEFTPLLSDSFLLGLVGLVVLIVGVFTSLYRLHLREISKNEQYLFGFLRIRIAALTSNMEGFQNDVRRALTEGAFDFAEEKPLHDRGKKLDSPLPGHPASDLATIVANKMLEGIGGISGKRA